MLIPCQKYFTVFLKGYKISDFYFTKYNKYVIIFRKILWFYEI